MKNNNLQELEEKLLLVYKFVSQEKLYENFFFQGTTLQRPYEYQNKLIKELMDMDDSIEFLKTCILEVEELKGTKTDEISFIDILEENETEALLKKYGMKQLEDVQDMDLTDLLEYF